MRIILAILAAYVLVATNDSRASETTPCNTAVILAYDAYLWATPDAKYPSIAQLRYAVDYLGDRPVKYERKVARSAVEFIANKMQAAGFRKPSVGATYDAAMEFMTRECAK